MWLRSLHVMGFMSMCICDISLVDVIQNVVIAKLLLNFRHTVKTLLTGHVKHVKGKK